MFVLVDAFIQLVFVSELLPAVRQRLARAMQQLAQVSVCHSKRLCCCCCRATAPNDELGGNQVDGVLTVQSCPEEEPERTPLAVSERPNGGVKFKLVSYFTQVCASH